MTTNDEPADHPALEALVDAISDALKPPQATAPTAIPDMIRIMGEGQIAVDDERWLGASIPSGTPFYSEDVVLGLREALADAQERGRSLERSVELLSDDGDEWGDQPTGYSNHDFLEAMSDLPNVKVRSLAAIALTMLGKSDVDAVFRLAGLKSLLKLVPTNG